MARPRVDPRRPPPTARLLAAAEAEFGRAGFASARLEDVAEGAGMTRASLLHHFASKEALYATVVRQGFDALGGALAVPLADTAPFAERVDALVAAFHDFLAARPPLARLLVRELIAAEGPGRAILLEEVVPLLSRVERFLIHQGGRRGPDTPPVRAALLATCSDILLRAAVEPELRLRLWGRRRADRTVARRLLLEDR